MNGYARYRLIKSFEQDIFNKHYLILTASLVLRFQNRNAWGIQPFPPPILCLIAPKPLNSIQNNCHVTCLHSGLVSPYQQVCVPPWL